VCVRVCVCVCECVCVCVCVHAMVNELFDTLNLFNYFSTLVDLDTANITICSPRVELERRCVLVW
jgi:hypothetical protein